MILWHLNYVILWHLNSHETDDKANMRDRELIYPRRCHIIPENRSAEVRKL